MDPYSPSPYSRNPYTSPQYSQNRYTPNNGYENYDTPPEQASWETTHKDGYDSYGSGHTVHKSNDSYDFEHGNSGGDRYVDIGEDHDERSKEEPSIYSQYVSDASVSMRKGFIVKVYLILSTQLLLVTAQCLICMLVNPVRNFLLNNTLIVWISFIPSFGLLIVLLFIRRKYPINFIILYLWTFCMGISLAFVTSLYTVTSVAITVSVTAGIVISLTVFTFVSKRDFSFMGAYLFAGLAALIFANLAQIVIFWITGAWSEWLDFVLSVVGALVFSLFIVYDTSQLIHKHTCDDYISASVSLFLDIINLFLNLLRILGSRRD